MGDASDTLLYPGEKVETIAGWPTLWNYLPAGTPNTTKPLMVFIPGAGHNARIAYGGHRGGNSSDFLAHWLSHLGFNMLAISYPLDSDPAIMPAVAPTFGVREWGQQAAATTQRVVKAECLSSHIVVLAWSMGGKILEPFCTEAKSLGITVDLFVSLAATPGLSALGSARPPPVGLVRSAGGYACIPKIFTYFFRQLQEESALNDGRVLIEEATYRSDYFGNSPIALGAYGLRYDPDVNGFVEDKLIGIREARADNFRALPLIASISPTSAMDIRHTLADKATWGFLLTYKLLADINEMSTRLGQPDPESWQKLVTLVHSAPERLNATVRGNHFFFVGKNGAKETAEAIVNLMEKAEGVRIHTSAFQTIKPT